MPNSNPNIYILIIAGMLFSLLSGLAVVLFYTRYHKRLTLEQEKIRDAKLQHQKELLYATIQSQEDERKRIGQDLHDDVGALLAKLRMMFKKVSTSFNQEEIEENKQLYTFIDKAIENVRNISHRLTPASLEFFGFSEAIEELCAITEKSTELEIELVNMATKELDEMNYTTCLHLFRVFEELLTNTIKHAKASAVKIVFSVVQNQLSCSYEDNGVGFQPSNEKSGIGMYNINSRIAIIKGTHQVTGAPNQGIRVLILFPIEKNNLNDIKNG